MCLSSNRKGRVQGLSNCKWNDFIPGRLLQDLSKLASTVLRQFLQRWYLVTRHDKFLPVLIEPMPRSEVSSFATLPSSVKKKKKKRDYDFFSGRELSGIGKWDQRWSTELQIEIENYWSSRIEERKFDEGSNDEKCYILSMFPYPSGNLHMGHVRVYSISDTLARYNRLKSRNVIHPMGWDAFGLPAENAAIERGLSPKGWTEENIANMKSVMEKMNLNLDWNREIATCDPDYYKWTQYLFLQLYKKDLVYKKEEFVNWDPVDETVLADEQVNEEGRSWRTGAIVEKKLLNQWFIRTTSYCKSLVDGLTNPELQDWKKIIKAQEQWFGTTDGTTIDFEIVENKTNIKHKLMTIWMRNPEFIHMIKYVAVQPDSVWNPGITVSGLMPYKVKNPLTGDVLPVFATNFFEYPINRDNYPAIPDIFESDRLYAQSVNFSYVSSGKLIATEEELMRQRELICAEARKMKIGGHPVSSKMKDWLISRQRYWGTPIPVIKCDKCGNQPVPEEDLPVKLPNVIKMGKGKYAYAEAEEWSNVKCPACGSPAERERDTMDTFVDSSWYYLRFLDPDNDNAPFSVEKAKKFMPVDIYVGGKEHALLHLYYARFMCHFLHDADLVPSREPFKRLIPQGIVRGKTYRLESTGEYLRPEEVDLTGEKPVHKKTRENVSVDWEKMSKSRFNGVEPTDLINKLGSDVTRLLILSDYSPWDERDWSENGLKGVQIMSSRLWSLIGRFIEVRSRTDLTRPQPEKLKELEDTCFDVRNYTVDMVTYSMEVTLNISLAVRKLQSELKTLRSIPDEGVMYSPQFERALAAFIIQFAPLAPCLGSEIWSGFLSAPNRISQNGEILWDRPVFMQSWPVLDESYISKFENGSGTFKNKYDKKKKLEKKEKRSESSELEEGAVLSN